MKPVEYIKIPATPVDMRNWVLNHAEKTGVSVNAYCKNNGISPMTLWRWGNHNVQDIRNIDLWKRLKG